MLLTMVFTVSLHKRGIQQAHCTVTIFYLLNAPFEDKMKTHITPVGAAG